MTNTNALSFRKNIFSVIEQTIKFNKRVKISTKYGKRELFYDEIDRYNKVMPMFFYNAKKSGSNKHIIRRCQTESS